MESIDENVVVACDFLKPYAADMRKRECLEAFAECQEIVERIRSVRDDQNKTEGTIWNMVLVSNDLTSYLYIIFYL